MSQFLSYTTRRPITFCSTWAPTNLDRGPSTHLDRGPSTLHHSHTFRNTHTHTHTHTQTHTHTNTHTHAHTYTHTHTTHTHTHTQDLHTHTHTHGTSGPIHWTVPATSEEVGTLLAMPKSATLATMSPSRNTLRVFTSRCMYPSWCRNCKPYFAQSSKVK